MPEAKYACEQDVLCGVHKAKDPKNLSELEKKHLPVIDAPSCAGRDEAFDVSVKVGGIGGIEHPNEPAHSIEWVELYVGDTFIGRAQFSGGTSYPIAKFKVKLSHAHGPLKARTKCNLHGLWEGVKDLSIKE